VSCAVFASFAYAQTQKSHINISMLVDLFPIKAKMFCMFITGFLAACTAFFIAYAATRQARTALASNYTTAVLQISLYPFYWIEFLCMAVFGIVLLYDAIKCLLAIFNEDVLKRVV
jgi:TRAP-type C4-dicarboxylate transport system permease small subunit